MSLIVTKTQDNTCTYPQHSHKMTEFICYIEGQGNMKTEMGNIPFTTGTIIVIPAGIKHGSVSDKPYKNICIHTDELDVETKDILSGSDNSFGDASKLADLLLRLSYDPISNNNILKSVLKSYTELVFNLLQVYNKKDELIVFKDILYQNLHNPFFSLYDAEKSCGYAVDYFRSLFKKRYLVTPICFLTQIRMEYAKNMLDVYGNKIIIDKLAWNCGYQDALYFSKIFKKTYGVSPKKYVEK